MWMNEVDTKIYGFRPQERNNLCPRENESCITVYCLIIGLALVILMFV
jgi:hypothetical protein